MYVCYNNRDIIVWCVRDGREFDSRLVCFGFMCFIGHNVSPDGLQQNIIIKVKYYN